jgi:hypothetical protein
VLEASVLGKKLEKNFNSLVFPSNDAWQASVEDLYSDIRTWFSTYREIRRQYLSVVESFARDSGRYFEDAQQNLATLKSTAKAIKERAIEPSFDLLEQISVQLGAVRDEISVIRFT